MPSLEQERLDVVKAAYHEVEQALQNRAADRHVAEGTAYRTAYELLRRRAISQELFQAWDALRVAYELYTQTGRPPEPTGMSKFLDLARRVAAALEDAGPQAAAA
jgi:cell fate (sporulation/competence/biofilm development) regulator YlbF (YheA/YmcA/DUF963 family)